MTRNPIPPCVAALVIAMSSVCAAEPSPPGAPVAGEAKDEFRHGERAFAAGDYARALGHFQNAERLAPHPAVRFNIAICLDKLGRIREALGLYKKLVADGALTDSARTEAADRAKRAAAALATLRIDGRRGTEAVVDDRDSCRVPCSLQLDPGEHQLRTEGSTVSRRIRLGSGEELRVSVAGEAKPTPTSSSGEGGGVATARSEAPSAKDAADQGDRSRFGTLSLIGGGVAIVGLGVFTYYGIRTESLHQDYLDDPDSDTRERGIRSRTVANVALGVALVGTALVVIDWATSPSGKPSARPPARNSARPRSASFPSSVLAPM